MVTVTCQYTGIQFEASSSRTKNHPMVAAFLNDASSNRLQAGAYAKAKSLLQLAKGQFSTIEEIMDFVASAYAEWCESGKNNVTVKSFRERQEAGRRAVAAMTRSENHEERNDGVGGQYNAGQGRYA